MVANIIYQLQQNNVATTALQQEPQYQNTNQNNYIRAKEVGVFDPNLKDIKVNGSGIVNIGKLTVYIDVYAFTNQIREIANKKGDQVVQENWIAQLYSKGIIQYTHELSNLERDLLTNASINKICSALTKRFKESVSSAIKNMGKIQFSLANLQKGELVRSFTQTMFRHAKAAGMESDFLQLIVAYNTLELSIQVNVLVLIELIAKGKQLKEVDSKLILFENIVKEVNTIN